MRASALVSEALRNLRTGSTRALLLCALAFGLTAGPCLLDLIAVTTILDEQRSFRQAGAAVQIVEAAGSIAPEQCLAFATVPGVVGALALRMGPSSFRAASLPRTQPALVEVTGDVSTMLHVDSLEFDGVLLSEQLADTLSAEPGSEVPLLGSPAEVPVRGIFLWPDDGRLPTLSGAAVVEVPPAGAFDECWVEIWPVDDMLGASILSAVAQGEASPIRAQLNARLGEGHSTVALLDARITAFARYFAITAAGLLGFASTWMRRVEIASNLHAGATRSAVTLQTLLETTAWGTVHVIAVWACLLAAARALAYPADASAVFVSQAMTAGAASLAILLGALVGASSVRRSALFRYAKDR